MVGTKNLHDPRLATWMLRLGLAFVFAYAGIESIREPLAWAGYLPHFLATSDQATNLVRVFGTFELLLVAWLLVGKYLRYAALVAFALLAGIVVVNPAALTVTFRDVGLAAMAAALFFMA